jgi:hypothetical protein
MNDKHLHGARHFIYLCKKKIACERNGYWIALQGNLCLTVFPHQFIQGRYENE